MDFSPQRECFVVSSNASPKTLLKTIFTILLLGLAVGESCAVDYSDCFVVGEVSEYKVSWMGVPLAWSRNTTDRIEENGRQLIRIQTISKSYKAFAKIYKVDDVKEVIIDPQTGLPVRIDNRMNEGNIHKSQLTLFDHANRSVLFIDRVANTTNQVDIASQTRDVVSFLYSMRNEALENLAKKEHTLCVGGKLYSLSIKINKEKWFKLPDYGKVRCVEVEPIAEFDGLFLRKGKIFFWISKQERRMITCIKAQVPVGKIVVKLQKVTGPGDDFWVRH